MATKIKGHWLDELFGEDAGIIVSWDAVEDPYPRSTLLHFEEGFSVDYDSSTGKVTVGIRFLELDGDVVGDSDENRVTTISGDEEDREVQMECVALKWDASASAAEPEIRIAEGGELEVIHNGERVLSLHSGGVRVGGAEVESVNQLIGGIQFTRQFINTTPVTLDATTTSSLLVINASVERTVNLPATPDDARVWFWVLVGGTSNITIGRSGRLINGAASNYTPPNNSRGIIFSDGTDYYTFAGLG